MEELLALVLLVLFKPCPSGQDHVVAVLVQFDDLGIDVRADVWLEVTYPSQLDKRCRKEAAEPNVNDETPLHNLDHRPGDHAVGFLDLFDLAPGPLVLGALLGENQPPLLVLALEDHGLDPLTQRDHLGRVDTVANGEFTRRNHTLGLVPDVDEDFVLVDPYNGSLDKLAVLEVQHRGQIGLFEAEGAEVVLHDLAWGVLPALVKGPHGRGGGWGQGLLGHVFFSSDREIGGHGRRRWSRRTGKAYRWTLRTPSGVASHAFASAQVSPVARCTSRSTRRSKAPAIVWVTNSVTSSSSSSGTSRMTSS